MAKDQEHPNPPGQDKETKIYVNTLPHMWTKKTISFEEVVVLAYPDTTRKEFDVTYTRGQSDQEGELLEGKSIHVHPEMEFTVTPTNES